MSLPEPGTIPLPSDTGISGSRKIRLNRNCSMSEIKEEVEEETSTVNKETKTNLVDSVFSNFVAKKFEEIEKERRKSESGTKDKKHKHKKSGKEKHKKRKHKDKSHEKEKKEADDSSSEVEDSAGGFFAKESFLEPGTKEDSDNSKESDNNGIKHKKHKKHKKKEHKHKHKHKDKHDKDHSKKESSNSKDNDNIAKDKPSPKNIFADKLEKAIEHKLSSLKENLNKKHKALEDLGRDLAMPEKKIKMMTELTLNEKLKEIKSEKRKITLSRSPLDNNISTGFENSAKTGEDPNSSVDKNESSNASDNRSVLNTSGSLKIQISTEDNVAPAEKDEDGFLAMKPRKDRDEEAYEKPSVGANDNKSSTNAQLAKKPQGMKLGLKLSENSMSLISSGIKVENDPKKRNREEGEITDSQDSTFSGSSSSAESDSSEGEIKEDSKKKKKPDDKKRSRKDKSRKRSRSKSPRKNRRSRSRSFDEQKGVWKSKSLRRRRSSSRSRNRDRGRRSRDRESHQSRRRSRSHERSRHSDRNFYYNDRYKKRSRSRERRRSPKDLRLKIDKAKLREIAMKNAYAMLGGDEEAVKNLKPDQIAALKAGGKSVEELTNFCRKIAEKDPARASSSDEESRPRVPASDDEDAPDAPFIHHPFKVNPAAANIAMNIRNARQLPVTSFADRTAKSGELRLQFPVSSGSQHKNKEDEWVPVEKKTSATTATPAIAAPVKPIITATNTTSTAKPLPKPGALIPPSTVAQPSSSAEATPAASSTGTGTGKVFPEALNVNISDVVSERLSAMRKLQCNPNDVEAMGAMYKSQQEMKRWAQNQQVPGQFTGSTGVKVLSQKELQGSGYQAWIKKDLFQRAAPVRGGIGRLLLQKMGWKEGTGLGKEETGSVEPLNLEIKCDRKGLLTADEAPPGPPGRGKGVKAPVVRDLSGKHPVSALMELCKRRKWGQPEFDLVFECGPPHKKNFLFKCTVDNVDYQPTIASSNKKHAKAQAATIVLQTFGLVPKDEAV